MGVFVFLPLVLPLSAVPVASMAEGHLHPRAATRLLTAFSVLLAAAGALCLGLVFVVGTAQVPGNPLPDGWSDPTVRHAVPYITPAGTVGFVWLVVSLVALGRTLWRRVRARARAQAAIRELPGASELAVLPDDEAYAYALPGRRRRPGRTGRIVVSTAMLACLDVDERRALLAHERAHLTGRHHRYLLAAQLAACVHPLLRPLRDAIAYSVERWADEEAAGAVGDRRATACAVGKAALASRRHPLAGYAAFAAVGPVPRRVAALLAPAPPSRKWPSPLTPAGVAAAVAAAGATASVLSALNATVALFLILKAVTSW